ncbi:MAG: efflux transporter periplasmic adaptor subunit [Alphaproteobacteria bacterium]|nr:MAG: efflux transporter periplasmic adaptor subunit [Alphaproteobacteria bacterium]
MIKKIIALILLSTLGGVLYYIGQLNQPSQQHRRGPGVVAVVVAPVISDIFTDTIEALGTTRANESVNLTASTTDKIAKINFTDGMTATKGQILVELVSDEERAALRSAEVNAKQQKRDLKRITGLVKARTLPTARLDDQKTLYKKAKADVQVALSRIRDRQIVAPFDGQLGLRLVSLGSLVTPGTVIATLDDLSLIKLDFTVPEGFLATLKVGQSIKALSDAYPKFHFEGIVSNIGSRVDRVSRAITVRAIIPNKDRKLRPGMLMRVKLIKNKSQSIMIPEEALVMTATNVYVFLVLETGQVKRQSVIIGRRRPGAIEILEGLHIGQKVVVEGTMKLQDNSKITIINPDRENSL